MNNETKTVKVRDLLGEAQATYELPQYRVRDIVNRLRAEGKVEPVAVGPQNAHHVTEEEKALILEACKASGERRKVAIANRTSPSEEDGDGQEISNLQALANAPGPRPSVQRRPPDEDSEDSEKPQNERERRSRLGWIVGVGVVVGVGGLLFWLLRKKRTQAQPAGQPTPPPAAPSNVPPTQEDLMNAYRRRIAELARQ